MNRRRSVKSACVALAMLWPIAAGAKGPISELEPRNVDARIAVRSLERNAPRPEQFDQVELLRATFPELAATFNVSTGVTRTLSARVGYLSDPTERPALKVARDFVRHRTALLGLSGSDVEDMELTDTVVSRVSGTSHFYFRQRSFGLPLYTGELQVHVDTEGRVLRVSNNFLRDLDRSVNTTEPVLDAEEAIRRAGHSIQLVDRQIANAVRSPGELMLLAIRHGEARLVWNFQLETSDSQHYYDFTVDAETGQVWTRFDWVQDSEFEVYAQPTESPECTSPLPPSDSRVTVLDPEHPTASQLGWFDDGVFSARNFQGNNVHAYPDPLGVNSPFVEFICGLSGDHICDFFLDLNLEPEDYMGAATTNLFYWTNIIHDVQYLYGFDEDAGNFQENNFTFGGVGSDSLDAEAQDGGISIFGFPILCNANMFTPPDGAKPRMQMFPCDNTVPMRDGDFDNGVIVHEYGHGISQRQVGGPATTSCLSNQQQMGEGISDWLALVYTADSSDLASDPRGIGNYLFGDTCSDAGIRSAPYSTDFAVNDYTYADIATEAVPHGVGFVWATAAWEVYWELVGLHGFDSDLYNANGGAGNQRAMLYHNEALQTVNCHPTFIDLRDAMIAAAQVSDPDDVCPMWEAFARRGLGSGATTLGPDDLSPVEDFTLPVSCADFTLMAPVPGTAGFLNDFDFIGATPSADVYLVTGTSGGSTNINIPGCGFVTTDLGGVVRRIANSTADLIGTGSVPRFIPAGQTGITRGFQLVDADSCRPSNRVVTTF